MSRTLNIEAEQAILTGLMAWPEAFDQVADTVVNADFANKAHRAIHAAMERLIAACKPIDAITVHDAIKAAHGSQEVPIEDLSFLAQRGDVRRKSMRRYAEIVRQASLERALLAAVERADEIATGDGDFAERLERATALFSGMRLNATRNAPRLMGDMLVGRIDHYTALQTGETPAAWATRIPRLDTLLSGGLRPGRVYVLAARPKIGKTSLASQIVLNLARNDHLTSLVLTQEMPSEEVVDRAIANMGYVDYTGLQTGKFGKNDEDANDDWSRICDAVEIGRNLPVWIDDQAGLTIADIRAKARSIKGLKLLVLDYLQLCSGSSAKSEANRNTEIELISRGVKTLAKELGIAVLMLSQLNREVDKRQDKRPHLSDLRDSGSIEQDADAVIFLWKAREFDSDGHRLIGCAVEANRNGPTGEFGLDFQGKYQRWGESDQDPRCEPKTAIARGQSKGYD